MSAGNLILLALAIPLIGTVLILMSRGRPNQREIVTLATGVAMLAVVVSLVPEGFNGGRPGVTLWEILPGLEIRFELEPLGMMFACMVSLIPPTKARALKRRSDRRTCLTLLTD